MRTRLRRLRSFIKPYVPAPITSQWQKYRFDMEQAQYRDMPLRDVFEQIYEENVWDRGEGKARYRSGPGSDATVSASYEAFVVSYIMRHAHVRRLVDIGCGDFQVSGRILAALAARDRTIAYVGCDIASNVVAHNSRVHAGPGVRFAELDITRQAPPEGDLVTVREVFQHLSNAHISAALANLSQMFDRAIVTESLTPGTSRPNIDIVSGYRTRDGYQSGVYLDEPPFSLTVLEEHVNAWSPTEHLRTTVVALR